MADLDLENVDTVKAFFTVVVGAVIGAFLFYLYARLVRPAVSGAAAQVSTAPISTTTTGV